MQTHHVLRFEIGELISAERLSAASDSDAVCEILHLAELARLWQPDCSKSVSSPAGTRTKNDERGSRRQTSTQRYDWLRQPGRNLRCPRFRQGLSIDPAPDFLGEPIMRKSGPVVVGNFCHSGFSLRSRRAIALINRSQGLAPASV